jgi:TP901-1 family phage major tail protein
MAGFIGRTLLVKRNGATVASVVSKSISIGNEPVDVTTDDDSGWRTLLEAAGVKTVDISVEGVLVAGHDTHIQDLISGTTIRAGEVTLPSGATLTGNWRLNAAEISGETAGRVEFSGTLQSTGTITFTPAP